MSKRFGLRPTWSPIHFFGNRTQFHKSTRSQKKNLHWAWSANLPFYLRSICRIVCRDHLLDWAWRQQKFCFNGFLIGALIAITKYAIHAQIPNIQSICSVFIQLLNYFVRFTENFIMSLRSVPKAIAIFSFFFILLFVQCSVCKYLFKYSIFMNTEKCPRI